MTGLSWAERHSFAQDVLLTPWVKNGAVFPFWIDDQRFWYPRVGDDGRELRVVDASTGENLATVSIAAIAESLAKHFDVPVEADQLLIGQPRFELDLSSLHITAFGEPFVFEISTGSIAIESKKDDVNWLASPDGATALLVRDNNLWLREIASGDEQALTTDGTDTYAYGETPASLRGLRRKLGDLTPEALWSPDGKWVLTVQTDDRHVPELAIADYAPEDGIRPVISANRTSLPADPKVTEFRMLAIEIQSGRQIEARYPRLPAVRMNTTPFGAKLVWWSADSRIAYFVDIERGEKAANVVAFDVETGAARVVFAETASTYVEVSVNVYSGALVRALPATNELVWYSERTGRGHLYLYDLASGTCRQAITAGDWQIRDILEVDAARREVIFIAAGIADQDPYICKPCAASLDGNDVRVLSDLAGDHRVWRSTDMSAMLKKMEGFDTEKLSGMSPSGDYFIETVSTVNTLPVTYLRDRGGAEIAVLERATAELPEGWQWPEPVECLAADEETKTYGLLFKPLGYEPGHKYPLIDYIYGGPQVSNVPHASFADGGMASITYQECLHLSALGAFVLVLDGRGTADREQAFRTASYRAAHTASNLEDQIAAIRQLADRDPDIDLERVGITGFSGGGYMTAHAALRFGDFFKVAVAGGGNYDQALFWHSWGERYHGAYEADHYSVQAAKTYADGLTGKLMLIHGLLDTGCHPAALFQLVQALIEANKDPDLVILPRAAHDMTGYGMRRRWDYFIIHLFGAVPPVAEPFVRQTDQVMDKMKANATSPKPAE